MTGFNIITVKKLKKAKSENCSNMNADDILEVGSDISFDTVTEVDGISKTKPKKVFYFTKDHPLHD